MAALSRPMFSDPGWREYGSTVLLDMDMKNHGMSSEPR
jgi:hypothetical protein